MSKTESSFSPMLTRRDFLRGSTALLAGVPALKSVHALEQQTGSVQNSYSSAIEEIKQFLPVAMAQRGITGASIALVNGENILWSEGFGYTNRSK